MERTLLEDTLRRVIREEMHSIPPTGFAPGRKGTLMIDALLTTADTALRTLFAPPRAALPTPQPTRAASELSEEEKKLARPP